MVPGWRFDGTRGSKDSSARTYVMIGWPTRTPLRISFDFDYLPRLSFHAEGLQNPGSSREPRGTMP